MGACVRILAHGPAAAGLVLMVPCAPSAASCPATLSPGTVSFGTHLLPAGALTGTYHKVLYLAYKLSV